MGWRDGLAVRSNCSSYREPQVSPGSHVRHLTTPCNSVPLNHLPLLASAGICTHVYRHTCMNTHTHTRNSLKRFNFSWRKKTRSFKPVPALQNSDVRLGSYFSYQARVNFEHRTHLYGLQGHWMTSPTALTIKYPEQLNISLTPYVCYDLL